MGDWCASGVYRRREPHLSPLYQVVEDHYEAFERCYDERFEQKYGFWRPIIREKFFKFTDCGDLHNGFARIRCKSCGTSFVHTAGKVLNFHPHVHAVASAGCFDRDGTFYRIPCMPDEEQLAKLFMHKVLKMMMEKDKIDDTVVERLTSWTYSGFNVHLGEVIPQEDTIARERAARYLVRSCISLEKMTYVAQEGKVLYGDSPETKVYDALDFLALLSCHITDRWERRVIAYGCWSNKSRGMRKKQQQVQISAEVQIIEPKLSSKTYRKRWAQWIQKIWGTDPLLCPKCQDKMGIVAFIEDQAVIKNILTYLDLWVVPERPPPKPLLRDLSEYDIAS